LGNHNLTWTNNSSTKRFKESQDVATLLNFEGQPATNNRFANNNIQDISLYATQLDYRYSNEKFTLESGLKYSFVKNKNDLDFFDGTNGTLIPDLTKSNLFNYKENILLVISPQNTNGKSGKLKLVCVRKQH